MVLQVGGITIEPRSNTVGMRMTSKGQVTIPKRIRQEMGFGPGDEIDFVPVNGRQGLAGLCRPV